MKKYFVMSTCRLEVRGIVLADSEENAVRTVKDNWYVYDKKNNNVTAGSIDPTVTSAPIVSATDDFFRITHIEEIPDEEEAIRCVPCRGCGAVSGKKCVSLITGGEIDEFHRSRRQAYTDMMYYFEKNIGIEGSHVA